MWLYCCPWYFSPWIAYLSSYSPQCDRSAETRGDRQGNGGDHEGGRSGSLRGCCRRLASSPSASAPASAAAVVRGKLRALGVFRLGGGSAVSPPFSRPRAQIYPVKALSNENTQNTTLIHSLDNTTGKKFNTYLKYFLTTKLKR